MTLPPPVTKNSSKKDLWEEILALRDEVDSQQKHLNNAKSMLDKQIDHNMVTEYQLRCIREILSMEFTK